MKSQARAGGSLPSAGRGSLGFRAAHLSGKVPSTLCQVVAWCRGHQPVGIEGVAQFGGGASLRDLGQKPYALWAKVAKLTALLLSLLGSPSLSPRPPGSLGLCPSTSHCRPQSTGRPPLPSRQRVEVAGRAGKGRRGRSYRNRLGLGDCSTGEPGRLASTGPHFHQPPSLLALHCKHSSPTSVAAAPEGGTATDPARGRQKHLTPSFLPGRAYRPEDGAGPGFPDCVTLSGALMAALAGPRLATWINRLHVGSYSCQSRIHSAGIPRALPGCPALGLAQTGKSKRGALREPTF